MDKIGKVFREFENQLRMADLKNAYALATELHSEGMSRSGIEEMLYAAGYEKDIVEDAIKELPTKKR